MVSNLNKPTYGQSCSLARPLRLCRAPRRPPGRSSSSSTAPTSAALAPGQRHAISPSLSTLGAGVHHVAAVYSGDASYTPLASTVEATTVAPAPLLVVANDSPRLYGQPTFPLAASYSGFVNGDTPASLKTPTVLTAWGSPFSPVGTCTITAAGASSADYAIVYSPGTLHVLPTLAGATPLVLGEAAFVTTLYEEILGRMPDANGFTFWVRMLARGNQPQSVALAFWNSAEHRALLMSGHADDRAVHRPQQRAKRRTDCVRARPVGAGRSPGLGLLGSRRITANAFRPRRARRPIRPRRARQPSVHGDRGRPRRLAPGRAARNTRVSDVVEHVLHRTVYKAEVEEFNR